MVSCNPQSGMDQQPASRRRKHPDGISTATVYEHFFRWEQDRRCSFYLTGASMPLAHAFAEDYLLEEFAPAKTRFTYRVAIEPRLAVAMGGPISRMYFGSMFKSACKNLQSYVLKARTSRTVRLCYADIVTRPRAHRQSFGWLCRRGDRRLRACCLDGGGGRADCGNGCWQSVHRGVCGRTRTAAPLGPPWQ